MKSLYLKEIRGFSETTREGSNLLKLSDAAEAIGFKSIGAKISFKQLSEAPLPCIVHWNKNHFVVVYRISNGKTFF